MILLGVNIDHCATLRQARYREAAASAGGAIEPDPVTFALLCERAGADGITVHLREDRRHIQDRDVWRLRESIGTRDLVQLDVLWKAATSNLDSSTAPVALQSGVIGMVVPTWEGNRWQTGGQPREGKQLQDAVPTGLQVSLQVKGAQDVMTKSFLLGGL